MRYMIESPRWLASVGKTDEALKQLEAIAEANGTTVPPDAKSRLKIKGKKEAVYGLMSLFSSWRLAKNSCMVVINWTAVFVTYNVIVLNAANLGGNPFLDYFFQAIAEIPAYLIARYTCDKFGRRITQMSAFICNAFTCIPFIIIIVGKMIYWNLFQ